MSGRAHGLRVLLVEPSASGGLAAHVRMEREVLAEAGAQVRDAPVRIGPRPSLLDLLTIARLRRLLSAARRGAPPVDAVHAHGLRAGGLTALALPRTAAGRHRSRSRSGEAGPRAGDTPRLVVTLHNRIAGPFPVRVLGRSLLSIIVQRADVVLAVSPDLAEAAAGAARIEHAVIPAPARTSARTSAPLQTPAALVPSPAPEVPGAEGAGPGEPVPQVSGGPLEILAVGRLAPQKGFDILLEAVRTVKDHGADVRVRIAGDGPDRQALAARIAAHDLPVELLGRREDIPALLARADLVVSSARWEGQPVFLQEALAAGRPIVATDAGGTALVTGRAARLVAPGDPTALAGAILTMRNPRVRAAAGEASRERSRALPGRGELLDQLLDVLGPPGDLASCSSEAAGAELW